MSRISGFMCQYIVSLVVCGVVFSGSAFAQPDALREAVKERLNDGEVSDLHIPIAKKIVNGEDPEGVAQFAVEWDISRFESELGAAEIAQILESDVDVEGNLIVLGLLKGGTEGNGFLAKYDPRDGALIWIELTERVVGSYLGLNLEIDIDGNIFLSIMGSGGVYLQKYSTRGLMQWETNIDPSSGFSITVTELVTDSDGSLYVAGRKDNNLWISRFRQDGVLFWERTYSFGGSANINSLGFGVDRFDQLRIGASVSISPSTIENVVASVDPYGELNWVTHFENFGGAVSAVGPILDNNCNSYILDRTGNFLQVTKLDSEGDQVYSTVAADELTGAGADIEIANTYSHPNLRIVVDFDGRVHVTYGAIRSTSGNVKDLLIAVAQFSPAGEVAEQTVITFDSIGPRPESVDGLVVDRFGNPYISATYYNFSQSRARTEVFKLDKDNLAGGKVWSYELPTGVIDGQDNIIETRINDLIVDFGDNIYFAGTNNTSVKNTSYFAGRFGKISQPYTAVPTIAKNSPALQIHNQSLWAEGVGAVSAEASIFDIYPHQTEFDEELSETVDIPFLGEFGGSFDLAGNMAMGMGFQATASGGVVDINYPGDLDIAVPGSAKLAVGVPFTITAQFDAYSSGNIVSDATPELSAGLKANVGININSSASLIAFSQPLVDINLVNANASWEGLIPGLSMSLPTGDPGSWQDFGDERNIVSGRLTRPLFTSNGAINPSTGLMSSNLVPEVFFNIRGNMTNYISTYQFGTPTIYAIGEGDSSDWSFGASVNIAQAFADLRLEANQTLDFVPTVSVIYEFSPEVRIVGQSGTHSMVEIPMTQSGSTWTGSVNIEVVDTPLNNVLTIQPSSKISSTLHNRTWVDIQPFVGWETLAASANADAAGANLFGFDFCTLCYEIQLSDDIPIELFDSVLSMPDAIVNLDPIKVLITPDGRPRVGGTSRARLSAFIYDQIDANPFELAVFLNAPAKKMLVYGDFFSGAGNVPLIEGIVMCSQGREVLLETTVLNSRTALVEIPNLMRLVPGVARLWAVNSSGQALSESFDFPIELPVPNLGTAGPNLWAADPRLSSIAIDVIDGLTPSGNSSFIARRDYWSVLADMWDAIDAGNGTSLCDSFPLYDWAAEPPMPAVLIDITDYPLFASTRHHWSFDGDFMDSAGTADGTPGATTPGFVTEGVPNYLGEAAEFSGGKITVDRSAMTHMGFGDYTVAFWMKLNSSGSTNRRIFSSKAVGDATGLSISVVNGKGFVYFGGTNGNSKTLPNGLIFPTDEKWHHYTVTIVPDGRVNWFRNGVLETSVPVFGKFEANVQHSDSISIGMSNSDTNPLHGQLSDFNIFSHVISDNAIQTLSTPLGQMPIGRFRQPVENGILYSLMPKSEYDKPKLVSISLDVAGPGGGKSNTIDLTVAAPQPVVSNIIPRAIYPDYGEFVMTVEGPLSVPYFNGFEEERFGNFNRASIVHLDGIPLATTYVTPGTLEAVVPAELTTLQGNALITVYTPSNGTGYFDSFSGGIVESGGESNGIAFAVQYPTPIITAMSPELTSKALIDRCPDNPGMVRLKITGENFWPGATIWVDGVEHVTTDQTTKGNGLITRGIAGLDLSYNVIYTDLSIFDLSRIYSAPVVVMNPDGTISDRVYLDIVDEATYEAYYGVKLPPQMLPGECK